MLTPKNEGPSSGAVAPNTETNRTLKELMDGYHHQDTFLLEYSVVVSNTGSKSVIV